MKKILLLCVFLSTGVSVAKSTDVDFMVINQEKTGYSPNETKQFIQERIEFNNRLFEENELSVARSMGSIKSANTDLDVQSFGKEVFGVISRVYDVDSSSLGASLALSTGKLGKEVGNWLKSSPDNYKVILLPMVKDDLDCGMTYMDDDNGFTLMYLDSNGRCSANWILAHELGHQDGLQHEDEINPLKEGVAQGSKCIDGKSLMHSGLTGVRTLLSGNPSQCPSSNKLNPFTYYEKISKKNAKSHFERPVFVNEKRPLVISEIYNMDKQGFKVKLIFYNPHKKPFVGSIKLVNKNAPMHVKNRTFIPHAKAKVDGKSVGRYEVMVSRDKLSAYGGHLQIVSEIDWSG